MTPLKESAPRVPAPYGDAILYYPQIDTLAALSEGKKWKFADIRPDAIVGFVPNHNPMNIAEPLALYASLWSCLSPSKVSLGSKTPPFSTRLETLLGAFVLILGRPTMNQS